MCVLERQGEENEHMSSAELLPVRDTIIRNIHLELLLYHPDQWPNQIQTRNQIEWRT